MKIKDIFKVAASAAIGWGASKLIPGSIGTAVGKTLSSSLLSRGGGRDMGTVPGQYVPRNINLSQFGMGTYSSGSATSTPIKQITTNPERILAEWDYRLTQYARKAYVQTRIARSAKV